VPFDVPDGLPSDDTPAGLSPQVTKLMVPRRTKTAEDELTHLTRGARSMEVDEVALYARGGLHPVFPGTDAQEDESSGSKDVGGARTACDDKELK